MGVLNKILSPDLPTGKVLMFFRGVIGVVVMFIQRPSKKTLKLARRIFQVIPGYTMLSPIRLGSLAHLVEDLDEKNIDGDIVECGCWNGGSAAIMAAASKDNKVRRVRTLRIYDSFEGLPVPTENDGLEAKVLYFKGRDKGAQQSLKEIMQRFDISMDNVKITPGWFSDTLKNATVENIALLHIDADWYESCKEVLDNFYSKVVPGGYIVLDDYGRWQGSRKALEVYFKENNIEGVHLKRVGRYAAYFAKPIVINITQREAMVAA